MVVTYVARDVLSCFGCGTHIPRGGHFTREKGSMGDGKRLNYCPACRPFGAGAGGEV